MKILFRGKVVEPNKFISQSLKFANEIVVAFDIKSYTDKIRISYTNGFT